MEDRIKMLETKVKELESYISDITQTQNRTITLFNEFMDKCATNFIEIQNYFDSLKRN